MLVSVHRSGESANTVRLLTSHIDGEEVGTCVDVSRIDGDIQHVQGIEQRGACLIYGNHFRDSKLLLLIFHINKGRDGFVCLYSISKVGWLTSHVDRGRVPMYMYKDIGDIFEGNFHPTWSIRDALNEGQNILLLGMSGTFPKGSSYIVYK